MEGVTLMGLYSTPKAPDPKETAAAQATMNKETAITQYGLNATNQVTPDGSLSYKQIGKWEDGTPRYEATTSLTPEGQEIYNLGQGAEKNLASIAKDQSGRIGELLGTPLKLGNEETEARIWELGKGRLEPQFAKDEEATRTRLKNAGIQEGSAAWNSEMERGTMAKTDQLNQLLLSGRSLANQEMLTERNQPINETTALMSGSQVSMPGFTSTPQTQVAGVDYAGLVSDKYKADSDAAAAKMGGMFGLAAAPMQMFSFSDRDMKTDIDKIGETDNDLPIYSFRYKGDDKKQIGLMAQDVQKKVPSAVKRIAGHLAVNYDKALRSA